MTEEHRKYQCTCGFRIVYKETKNDVDYIHCASPKCNNIWIARREEDKTIPTFIELKKAYE